MPVSNRTKAMIRAARRAAERAQAAVEADPATTQDEESAAATVVADVVALSEAVDNLT